MRSVSLFCETSDAHVPFYAGSDQPQLHQEYTHTELSSTGGDISICLLYQRSRLTLLAVPEECLTCVSCIARNVSLGCCTGDASLVSVVPRGRLTCLLYWRNVSRVSVVHTGGDFSRVPHCTGGMSHLCLLYRRDLLTYLCLLYRRCFTCVCCTGGDISLVSVVKEGTTHSVSVVPEGTSHVSVVPEGRLTCVCCTGGMSHWCLLYRRGRLTCVCCGAPGRWAAVRACSATVGPRWPPRRSLPP